MPLTPLPFAPFFFLAHVTVNAPRRDDQARVAVVAAVAAVRPGARAAVPRGRNPHELSPCGVGGPAANARTRARRGVPTTDATSGRGRDGRTHRRHLSSQTATHERTAPPKAARGTGEGATSLAADK